jgi:hypothetical protein
MADHTWKKLVLGLGVFNDRHGCTVFWVFCFLPMNSGTAMTEPPGFFLMIKHHLKAKKVKIGCSINAQSEGMLSFLHSSTYVSEQTHPLSFKLLSIHLL